MTNSQPEISKNGNQSKSRSGKSSPSVQRIRTPHLEPISFGPEFPDQEVFQSCIAGPEFQDTYTSEP